MPDGFYLDNDVIIKICSYNAEQLILAVTFEGQLPPAILGLARFTCRSKIVRSRIIVKKAEAIASFDALSAIVRCLEPTQEEVELAAQLEHSAADMGFSFDAGESQIVAMVIVRNGLAFLTGDKRAITALSHILPSLRHKVGCLEQVITSMLYVEGLDPMRDNVCREKATDQAVHNCFQCATDDIDVSKVVSALKSYTDNMRLCAGTLLLPSDDLSGAVVS